MTPERTTTKSGKKPAKKRPDAPRASAESPERTAESIANDERRLASGAALVIPGVTIVASLGVAAVMSAGPALLVLAAGILLGTIALFWASLRTLTGDAPLPEDLEHATFDTSHDALAERKKMLLRALKDLESEKAVAKIDEQDYAELAATYRDEIKDIMRAMDTSIAPHYAAAEALLEKHLAKVGLAEEAAAAESDDSSDSSSDDSDDSDETKTDDSDDSDDSDESSASDSGTSDDADDASEPSSGAGDVAVAEKRACDACGTLNDADAKFCKSCGKTLTPPVAESPATDTPAADTASAADTSVDHAK